MAKSGGMAKGAGIAKGGPANETDWQRSEKNVSKDARPLSKDPNSFSKTVSRDAAIVLADV
jgi:hypothetical protein